MAINLSETPMQIVASREAGVIEGGLCEVVLIKIIVDCNQNADCFALV